MQRRIIRPRDGGASAGSGTTSPARRSSSRSAGVGEVAGGAQTGEACADAIEAVTGHRPEIKLPNDLLLGGRKVAGILAEAGEGRIVLGVGVNVATIPYQGATMLGAAVDRAQLLAELLDRLERAYDEWVSGPSR